LRRTVDRRGVDGAAPPQHLERFLAGHGLPSQVPQGQGDRLRPCPDAEPVHDRLDVDVLNLNVRADLGHTPITNHQSPIMRRTRAGVYFRSTSSCSHHGRHHQTSHGGADVTDVLFATYPTTSWPGLTRDPLGSACRVANTCAGGWHRRGDRRPTVTVEHLAAFAETFADLADAEVMKGAWG